jgi:hypothetical protein
MTDLPQLHDLLVDAARRRRRRARARRGIVRVSLLAAAAAFVVFAIPRIGQEPPDREVPAATPTPAPTTIQQAYGVFRRPARRSDEVQGFIGSSRLIATTPSAEVFLVRQGGKLCLLSRSRRHKGYGVGCGPARTYLDGHRPTGSFSDQKGPSTIAYAFPDGVESVTLTLENGDRGTYPVKDNGFARDIPARAVTLEWRAPDGTPQRSDLPAAPDFRASDFYSVLARREQPADRFEGLPGARLLVEGDGAKAWLVPRKGAVCLVLDADGLKTSGCRRNVADVRTPLIVALPSRRHVIAVAYPDYLRSVTVVPAGVPTVAGDNGLLILDGQLARGLRYRGKRGPLKPAARAEWPTAIPAME